MNWIVIAHVGMIAGVAMIGAAIGFVVGFSIRCKGCFRG